jgi:hypothetical protein
MLASYPYDFGCDNMVDEENGSRNTLSPLFFAVDEKI